jgi:hypothetical protein
VDVGDPARTRGRGGDSGLDAPAASRPSPPPHCVRRSPRRKDRRPPQADRGLLHAPIGHELHGRARPESAVGAPDSATRCLPRSVSAGSGLRLRCVPVGRAAVSRALASAPRHHALVRSGGESAPRDGPRRGRDPGGQTLFVVGDACRGGGSGARRERRFCQAVAGPGERLGGERTARRRAGGRHPRAPFGSLRRRPGQPPVSPRIGGEALAGPHRLDGPGAPVSLAAHGPVVLFPAPRAGIAQARRGLVVSGEFAPGYLPAQPDGT